uniref:Uncharacterized protein LOC102807873 n=1 Tax=Saccoglossus kowalevskii TaxID=10224 RepID=A0ABM0MD38_SACKO|nr:PREDICTED: uncharacterized protein LOC102807873 [Saccoglossus kowalevskii]
MRDDDDAFNRPSEESASDLMAKPQGAENETEMISEADDKMCDTIITDNTCHMGMRNNEVIDVAADLNELNPISNGVSRNTESVVVCDSNEGTTCESEGVESPVGSGVLSTSYAEGDLTVSGMNVGLALCITGIKNTDDSVNGMDKQEESKGVAEERDLHTVITERTEQAFMSVATDKNIPKNASAGELLNSDSRGNDEDVTDVCKEIRDADADGFGGESHGDTRNDGDEQETPNTLEKKCARVDDVDTTSENTFSAISRSDIYDNIHLESVSEIQEIKKRATSEDSNTICTLKVGGKEENDIGDVKITSIGENESGADSCSDHDSVTQSGAIKTGADISETLAVARQPLINEETGLPSTEENLRLGEHDFETGLKARPQCKGENFDKGGDQQQDMNTAQHLPDVEHQPEILHPLKAVRDVEFTSQPRLTTSNEHALMTKDDPNEDVQPETETGPKNYPKPETNDRGRNVVSGATENTYQLRDSLENTNKDEPRAMVTSDNVTLPSHDAIVTTGHDMVTSSDVTLPRGNVTTDCFNQPQVFDNDDHDIVAAVVDQQSSIEHSDENVKLLDEKVIESLTDTVEPMPIDNRMCDGHSPEPINVADSDSDIKLAPEIGKVTTNSNISRGQLPNANDVKSAILLDNEDIDADADVSMSDSGAPVSALSEAETKTIAEAQVESPTTEDTKYNILESTNNVNVTVDSKAIDDSHVIGEKQDNSDEGYKRDISLGSTIDDISSISTPVFESAPPTGQSSPYVPPDGVTRTEEIATEAIPVTSEQNSKTGESSELVPSKSTVKTECVENSGESQDLPSSTNDAARPGDEGKIIDSKNNNLPITPNDKCISTNETLETLNRNTHEEKIDDEIRGCTGNDQITKSGVEDVQTTDACVILSPDTAEPCERNDVITNDESAAATSALDVTNTPDTVTMQDHNKNTPTTAPVNAEKNPATENKTLEEHGNRVVRDKTYTRVYTAIESAFDVSGSDESSGDTNRVLKTRIIERSTSLFGKNEKTEVANRLVDMPTEQRADDTIEPIPSAQIDPAKQRAPKTDVEGASTRNPEEYLHIARQTEYSDKSSTKENQNGEHEKVQETIKTIVTEKDGGSPVESKQVEIEVTSREVFPKVVITPNPTELREDESETERQRANIIGNEPSEDVLKTIPAVRQDCLNIKNVGKERRRSLEIKEEGFSMVVLSADECDDVDPVPRKGDIVKPVTVRNGNSCNETKRKCPSEINNSGITRAENKCSPELSPTHAAKPVLENTKDIAIIKKQPGPDVDKRQSRFSQLNSGTPAKVVETIDEAVMSDIDKPPEFLEFELIAMDRDSDSDLERVKGNKGHATVTVVACNRDQEEPESDTAYIAELRDLMPIPSGYDSDIDSSHQEKCEDTSKKRRRRRHSIKEVGTEKQISKQMLPTDEDEFPKDRKNSKSSAKQTKTDIHQVGTAPPTLKKTENSKNAKERNEKSKQEKIIKLPEKAENVSTDNKGVLLDTETKKNQSSGKKTKQEKTKGPEVDHRKKIAPKTEQMEDIEPSFGDINEVENITIPPSGGTGRKGRKLAKEAKDKLDGILKKSDSTKNAKKKPPKDVGNAVRTLARLQAETPQESKDPTTAQTHPMTTDAKKRKKRKAKKSPTSVSETPPASDAREVKSVSVGVQVDDVISRSKVAVRDRGVQVSLEVTEEEDDVEDTASEMSEDRRTMNSVSKSESQSTECGNYVTEFPYPAGSMPRLIGRKGKNIRQIANRTGTVITNHPSDVKEFHLIRIEAEHPKKLWMAMMIIQKEPRRD